MSQRIYLVEFVGRETSGPIANSLFGIGDEVIGIFGFFGVSTPRGFDRLFPIGIDFESQISVAGNIQQLTFGIQDFRCVALMKD